MSKKLQGNGMWESSRMMLPEHREQIIRHKQEMNLQPKPLLDEQKLDELSRQLFAAVAVKLEVTVTVFDRYGNQTVKGRIEKVDPLLKRAKISNQHSGAWIELIDILHIASAESPADM
ncbi:YolD-like family protein [Paenibacillus thalictri]|uniref:YolD-like family protein n=1 Tax=Paenibacillus thalictri TaxID=2527873 RepID=A0A4Q9DNP7_9BACL|nr:YolD-like family protein [Paenibacillus thalictri]TBL77671.1 YolD-like family protein [Paenibacillus thalictri]